MPAFRVKKLRIEDDLSYDLIPKRQHSNDAGLDLYAAKSYYLEPSKRRLVVTGIAVEIPSGYAGLITPRSGLALKTGLTVLNTPGLIDSGYRGEVGVILYNAGEEAIFIAPGNRIAQLVIVSVPMFEPVEVKELNNTKRGEGGFGSTGH